MVDNPGTRPGGGPLIYAIIGMVLLAALLSGGAYAWITGRILTRPVGPLEKVVIANQMYTGSCPVIAAQAKGYFTSEGIQAIVPIYSSGKAALDAVFGGKADLGVSADLPVMFAVMNRQPLSVIATIAKAENDVGIVGRKDKGITAPGSLKGKRIGVSIGTSGHFVLDLFLERQKLSVRDVTVHELGTESFYDALASGEIDAASTWEPTLGALQSQLGANSVTFLAGDIYWVTLNVAGTQAYIASHAKTLEKVLRALIRGARFCEDEPDEARELVAAALKVGAAGLKASWPDYRFRVTLDQSVSVTAVPCRPLSWRSGRSLFCGHH
jgi:NitT/TauT family transport system substrate-binding protein